MELGDKQMNGVWIKSLLDVRYKEPASTDCKGCLTDEFMDFVTF